MKAFLLDTNIPSELTRSRPDSNVSNWLLAQEEQSLFVSVISVGEFRRGIAMLPQGERQTKLDRWFEEDLLPRFNRRILPVTQEIAIRWGILDGERQRRGMPLNTADGLIAATALQHDCAVVTRNTRDFAGLGLSLVDPWNAKSI